MDEQQIVQRVKADWTSVILATLHQRGLLKRDRHGGLVVPQAAAYYLEDRTVFVLDMQRLAGIPREAWLDKALWQQGRAASGGRAFFVSDGGGLAITLGHQPGPRLKQLPARILLSTEWLTDRAYHVTLGVELKRRQPVLLDLAGEHRAILCGGATGGGKTNLLQSIVIQLVKKHPPGELRVAIVDTKRVDSSLLMHLPHLFAPIAHTMDEAAILIQQVEGERIRRQALQAGAAAKDWRVYNARLKEGDPLPLLLLIVDEAADFAKTTVMDTLVEIARKGRAFGVSVIVATQRPTMDVIDGQVKANLTTTIAFQTTTASQSRVILDRNGAEHLHEPGRCLTFVGQHWREVQTLLVSEGDLREIASQAFTPQSPLSEVEVALVRYAVTELGGAFTIDRLAPAFQGRISKYKLTELGQVWEARGWLTEPAHRADSRRVTDELLSLCALPSPGEEKS